jgi:hypothetical protein
MSAMMDDPSMVTKNGSFADFQVITAASSSKDLCLLSSGRSVSADFSQLLGSHLLGMKGRDPQDSPASSKGSFHHFPLIGASADFVECGEGTAAGA